MRFRQRNQELKINQFKYVIIDTDGGSDDCQALVALDYYIKKSGKKLLGISCSDGNAYLRQVLMNVLVTQAVCKSSYPIYPGIETSMAGQTLKDNYFGDDGIGNTQKQYMNSLKIDKSLIKQEKAYKFIADSAIKYKGQIALICIGPLTNLALAYHYNNQIKDCFANISIMGCSDTLAGLHTFYTAQFNVGLDPQASFIVFQKFKDIILVSYDTSVLGIPAKQTEQLFLNKTIPRGDFIRRIYDYLYKKQYFIMPVVCDPLTVLVLFRPQIVSSGQQIRMKIQAKGQRTRGCSIIDFMSPEAQNPNAYLIKQFNVQKIVEELLKSYQQI